MNSPTPEQIEDLKFIWAFMIENGQLTDGSWSYYGGGWNGDHAYDYAKRVSFKASLVADIQSVGVDWQKTDIPVYECHSEFCGTDSPSNDCHTLLGTITLKDGQIFRLGTNDSDDAHRDAIERLHGAKRESPQDLVKKIFG